MTEESGHAFTDEPHSHRTESDHGKFVGRVIVEWQDDGREMRLVLPFQYLDPKHVEWNAPETAYIDGASIPQFLWAIVGSPYVGKYRNASVVHDIACCEQKRPWQQVHRMFYEACRCGGVPRIRAKIMYAAVYHFGPRWKTVSEIGDRTFRNEQEFDELREYIERKDPDLDEIDNYTVRRQLGLNCFKP